MAAMEWIKCSERLPEKDGQYLAVLIDYHGTPEKHPGVVCAEFTTDLSSLGFGDQPFPSENRPGWYESWYDFRDEDDVYREIEVTHWMPFPEPPEE